MGSHEIDLIDLEKMDYAAHIPAGGRPRPYVVSPDGNTVYVSVADLLGFVIVDIPGQKAVQGVEMPSQHKTLRPLQDETHDTPTHGLARPPDGSDVRGPSLFDD